MFLGEMLCMVAFLIMVWNLKRAGEYVAEAKEFSPLIFVLPSCCDMTATSLMYIGLTMTDASVFQMLRGSVVIFTGIHSVLFLGRKLKPFHWVAMLLVLIGVGVVGYASISSTSSGSSDGGNHTNSGNHTNHNITNNSTGEFSGCGSTESKKDQAFLGNMLIIGAQLIAAIQMCVEEKYVGG